MMTVRWQNEGLFIPRVLVSNSAADMISLLHPSDETAASATAAAIKASVLDPAKVNKLVGVDNAFVARAGELQVFFKIEGDTIVITSILAQT
ncbi:hypothetical protein [Methylobacterium nonmethylotrophicum]|uniref:Uncharacterized protein n=1 Tax=Methylobacterium nonmethylotrophicum TaxID=1141884 RepID=A0A4Z0NLC2_9HYPH|nr:hypothetical protein [Methylobacterium nonmethylotrophicum]TGD96308.1 hypothetical protein EU555_24260 [Methylobacterium nonmethylotrophicum]